MYGLDIIDFNYEDISVTYHMIKQITSKCNDLKPHKAVILFYDVVKNSNMDFLGSLPENFLQDFRKGLSWNSSIGIWTG